MLPLGSKSLKPMKQIVRKFGDATTVVDICSEEQEQLLSPRSMEEEMEIRLAKDADDGLAMSEICCHLSMPLVTFLIIIFFLVKTETLLTVDSESE